MSADQQRGPGWRPIGVTGAVMASLTAPFVAYQEGVIPYTYADPIGIPTICAGETGPHLEFGQRTTIEDCLRRLDKRLTLRWAEIEPCLQREVTVPQAMALLSWSDNVGSGAACRSTLLRRLNAGEPAALWCAELLRWDKAKGRVLPGLTKRRTREMALCLGDPNYMRAA